METWALALWADGEKAVHLHGCGDMAFRRARPRRLDGSSPRVWRHDIHSVCVSCWTRFISTGVETWLRRCISARMASVHLHGCGDMVRRSRRYSTTRGSSPRVWRHGIICRDVLNQTWFISTGVETCGRYAPERSPPTVHLHGCGDMGLVGGATSGEIGSSPRVWRHGRSPLRSAMSQRFISTGVETC